MFARACVLPPLLAAALLGLLGREEVWLPELNATTTCGWLQEQRGLQPGAMAGTRRLRHCLSAGRSSEVWLAWYGGEGGADVAVKILKFRSRVSQLREECAAFDRLRRGGVTRVPGCMEDGLLDLEGARLAFSTRELVPGRRVSDLLWEAHELLRLPAELARLRTVFGVVLSTFEVLDSGIRSCAVASSRGCHYIVEASIYNVMVAGDGRAFVVDFDELGPYSRRNYLDQTSPPYLSLRERLKECLTRSLFVSLLMLLMVGATATAGNPPLMAQLGVDLTWRGSKIDHCRSSGFTDDELALQAVSNVSEDWQWDGMSPLSEKRRQPTSRDMDTVSMILSRIHPAYLEDWARLEGGREVLLDALASIRSYEIQWPPRFISSLQQWLELLDSHAAERRLGGT